MVGEDRRKGFPSLSATFDTKAEAQLWTAEIEGDMSRARFVDMWEAERTALAEALDRYAREITSSKKGAKQELTRINKWKKHALADRVLAVLKSSDFAL